MYCDIPNTNGNNSVVAVAAAAAEEQQSKNGNEPLKTYARTHTYTHTHARLLAHRHIHDVLVQWGRRRHSLLASMTNACEWTRRVCEYIWALLLGLFAALRSPSPPRCQASGILDLTLQRLVYFTFHWISSISGTFVVLFPVSQQQQQQFQPSQQTKRN